MFGFKLSHVLSLVLGESCISNLASFFVSEVQVVLISILITWIIWTRTFTDKENTKAERDFVLQIAAQERLGAQQPGRDWIGDPDLLLSALGLLSPAAPVL